MPTPAAWLPMTNSRMLVEAKRISPPFSTVIVPVPSSDANRPRFAHSHTPLPVTVSVPTPPANRPMQLQSVLRTKPPERTIEPVPYAPT